ncbi:MAG: ABC transporter permease subunit [Candidatus Krumholzibacteriota bacterium]|nr:ABC transporter permease subunit [Candidatus Krumholzibacteriota bacterium]
MLKSRNIAQIFKKEFTVYFISPIAYIVISIFLIVTGWFFFSTFFLYNQAELRSFFSLLPITFSFIIPAVTMHLFSEELSSGSYEVLLTLPVSIKDIIAGKFLAALAFVVIMLLPTVSYAISVSLLGDIDWGPVAGGYLGAILLGAMFTSIGLFTSGLTKNQIIALLTAIGICFALTMIDNLLFFLPESMLGFFQQLGAGYHFSNITKGIIDSRDIIYFLSFIFIALYAAYLVMQEKK